MTLQAGMIKSGEERDGLRRLGSKPLIVSSIQEHVLVGLECLQNLMTGYWEM